MKKENLNKIENIQKSAFRELDKHVIDAFSTVSFINLFILQRYDRVRKAAFIFRFAQNILSIIRREDVK